MASKLHTTVSMHCHQWARVLPTNLINARPTEWRDTFGHMPATQLVSRHCNPPHASYATKRPGTAGQTHAGTAFIHDICSFLERLKPCHIWIRLLTAINFPRICARLWKWPGIYLLLAILVEKSQSADMKSHKWEQSKEECFNATNDIKHER